MKRIVIWLTLVCWATLWTHAADWRIGEAVYRDVKVRQVTARAVIIQHQGGISQILLADLPPEAQAQFGYDPQKAAAEQSRIDREHAEQLAQLEQMKAEVKNGSQRNPPTLEDAKTVIWQMRADRRNPLEIRRDVDLRATLREEGLYTKSQGRRPSCTVFAVLSALEYFSALNGQPTQYSEDYAIWATRRYLADQGRGASGEFEAGDAGFRLGDVHMALDAYGAAPLDAMPNTFGTGMERIEPPAEDLIATARQNVRLSALLVNHADWPANRELIIRALNLGFPVIIGVGWPHENTLRSAPLVSGQEPVSMHAVTLFGYRSDEGGKNLRFVFKNSWGPQWGSGGYGWITDDYLAKNFSSGMILDPQFGE